MRVLCVTSHGDTLNSVRPEAESFIGLRQAGVELDVMTEPDSVYADKLRAAGIEIHDYCIRRKFDLPAIRILRRLLVERRYEILYLFNNKAIVTGIAASLGLPVKVVTYRGQTGNVHRFDPTSYLMHLNPRVDKIICVADAVRKSLGPHLRDPGKAVCVYKGHDLSWYRDPPADLRALGVAPDAFVVGAVANARPRKGLPVLFEAARLLPAESTACFLLIGRDTDNEDMRARAALLPGRFHLLGFRADAPALIAACNASVLPALRREGLPKSVIESMVYGVAPIVSDTGGSAELIVDGESGIVVQPGDAAAIAAAVERLRTDPHGCRRMGAAARSRIDSHFNVRATVAQTLAVFESLLGQ